MHSFQPVDPPHSIEAEQRVLGAILLNNKAYEKVAEILEPEHFYLQAYARLYDLFRTLIQNGKPVDSVTVRGDIERDPVIKAAGGMAHLADLLHAVVGLGALPRNVADHAKVIRDHARRRRLIEVGEEIISRAFSPEPGETSDRQIEAAEAQLFELAEDDQQGGGFKTFGKFLHDAIEQADAAYRRDGALVGVGTGLTDIDRMLGGLHPSDLLILAGRPSMGKTSCATNMAFNAAKKHFRTNGEEGGWVGFFSLEMSGEQLAARILAEEARIASDSIRRGDLKPDDFTRFQEVQRDLGRIPLFVDDTPAITVGTLRARARRLARTAPPGRGCIVVDYLQLLRGDSRTDNRVNEVSEITRGLKAIAKELGVPVLALSQLSREVEKREDKRPQLADLRESGSIEQDADVVMFVFREQYYLERAEPMRNDKENDEKFNERYERWEARKREVQNLAEIIVAKQRHGPIGSVMLHFEGQFTKFSDLDRAHDHAGGF